MEAKEETIEVKALKESELKDDSKASIDINISAEDLKDIYPSKRYAEASLALAQLLKIRQVLIGKPEPNSDLFNWCIVWGANDKVHISSSSCHRILSFPTVDMTKSFLLDYADLLEIAKPLL